MYISKPLFVLFFRRGWAVKLLCKLVSLSPRTKAATVIHTDQLAAAMPATFACLTPLMHRLHTHYTQSPTGGLSLLLLLAQVRICKKYICMYICIYIYTCTYI